MVALPSEADLRKKVSEVIQNCKGLEAISLGALRSEVEASFGLPDKSLKQQRELFKNIAREEVGAATAAKAKADALAKSAEVARKRSPYVPLQHQLQPIARALSDSYTPVPDWRNFGYGDDGPTPKKQKKGRSAFEVFTGRNYSAIRQDFIGKNGASPSLGEIQKASAELWQQAPEEEKNDCQRESTAQNGTQFSPPMTKGKAPKKLAATFKGPLSKAQFSESGQNVRFTMDAPGLKGREDKRVLEPQFAAPRIFSTGSVGWHSSCQVFVTVAGKQVVAKMMLNVVVDGSKNWEAGEAIVDIEDLTDAIGAQDSGLVAASSSSVGSGATQRQASADMPAHTAASSPPASKPAPVAAIASSTASSQGETMLVDLVELVTAPHVTSVSTLESCGSKEQLVSIQLDDAVIVADAEVEVSASATTASAADAIQQAAAHVVAKEEAKEDVTNQEMKERKEKVNEEESCSTSGAAGEHAETSAGSKLAKEDKGKLDTDTDMPMTTSGNSSQSQTSTIEGGAAPSTPLQKPEQSEAAEVTGALATSAEATTPEAKTISDIPSP